MEGRGEGAWALGFCSWVLGRVHTLLHEFGGSDQLPAPTAVSSSSDALYPLKL